MDFFEVPVSLRSPFLVRWMTSSSAFAFAVPAVDAETGIGHVAGALVGCEVATVADAWADSAAAVGADQVQCTEEN